MKKRHNQQIGKSFEKEWMDYLHSLGYWVKEMVPLPDGSQPFDVLAIREGVVFAFDCKTLSGKRFPLSRVEDNQETAFKSLWEHGVHNTWFAVKTEDDAVHLLPSQDVIHLKEEGKKSINVEEDRYVCIHFKQDNN